ncbi:zinc-dependent peptidase [Curvibacter sp. RS43]|uniref:M90 family metallopeptidase n=1 Tax=Curvibacter microcysteis TaxID=3026419 RepID=UPI002361603F|nr:M90 family metallopeptidase [Curvibacter sp. RS43]MDD0811427.1 zinc-dependent peptidase [Curvibacter sp. RS43]
MNSGAFAVLVGLSLLGAAWLWLAPWRQAWRRWRVSRQAFPASWRAILREQVPLVARLPADLQLQLKRRMLVFLAEKPFLACDGLVLTEAMRVVIAAQACLLLLNRPGADFASLRQILLYPAPFWVDRVRAGAAGVVHEQRQALSGESWQQGQVILSWADVRAGSADPGDGRNVVIHEFAHQLDQDNGPANGAPALGGRRRQREWQQVMGAEFAALQARVAAGDPGLLDAYGASDPAEFFAVISEAFFEQGERLAEAHPALYRQLSLFYRVLPLSWR